MIVVGLTARISRTTASRSAGTQNWRSPSS
jgi:hypothetical protein